MSSLTRDTVRQLQNTLQDAAIRCSERCLYQSAKWYSSLALITPGAKILAPRIAELATSLPSEDEFSPGSDTDPDSPMQDGYQQPFSVPKVFPSNPDIEESRLEAQEVSKYILAKSYFDCREYDRCAAVFLPSNVSLEPASAASPDAANQSSSKNAKGKAKESGSSPLIGNPRLVDNPPQLSQKALFLALYAKYIGGEKRKNEESEMILGPADGGATVNKELVGLQRTLETWFLNREAEGKELSSQGWLEYLYGVVLIKGKSEGEGKQMLIRSVKLWPYNWSAWQELNEVVGNTEQVRWKNHFQTQSDLRV